jgi:hypothetical protein
MEGIAVRAEDEQPTARDTEERITAQGGHVRRLRW